MHIWCWIIVAGCAGLAAACFDEAALSDPNRKLLEEVQASAAEQMKGQLPMQVQEDVMITDVWAESANIGYHYEIDPAAFNLSPEEFVEQQRAYMRESICNARALSQCSHSGSQLYLCLSLSCG